ncbi:nuclear undecaprenyl pyrophosphate synthase-like protein [Aureobasidium sp. EXF-3400]|nr:nuclear undecaprenyl pyrophosphate synthase-like protein [Aureobasidium sp. EXF-12344]KAI4771664.1 nuclear undecaprenyl pyrophosphate synthase-like protein [Aureobasidium sp. EXF-3400]
MAGPREQEALRSNIGSDGRPLSAQERERLLQPYLPNDSPRKHQRTQPLRQLIKAALHLLLYNLIHFAFSVYHRFRVAYHNLIDRIFAVLYYHHRTPEYIQKDVHRLKKVPKHLSIILELDDNTRDNSSLEALIHNVCEVAAWSACAGVPLLSIYEPSGLLKQSLPLVHRRISRTLAAYFGHDNPNKPTLSLGAPHMQSFSPPASPKSSLHASSAKSPPHLSILLLSASDGRGTLVDLTKTLAEMSQKGKLAPKDISMDLVDAELTESVMGEPDLLMLFADSVHLKGYPPWQLRLTEIFHVPDNNGVGYQVFLRGLYKYAQAQMRFGS